MNHYLFSSWVPVGIAVLLLWMSLSAAARSDSTTEEGSKRWALLVAGSNDYENYRHQADICHAYQILRRGGLPDENIIVFMYDDIAFNIQNPRPGTIINKPNGPNVYEGVPKDYTGDETSPENLFAVLSGNRSATRGGSGKVLNSGPNDIVFIYYADHGSPGVICMADGGFITAKDLVDALKKKHAAKAYKKIVIYLEACESGSMFEGLLPNDINIYATTAANAHESSWAFYCRKEFNTCLGDQYSISWMEDSDRHDTRTETLLRQYETVRQRTFRHKLRSHVMQYGDLRMSSDFLVTYLGSDREQVDQNYKLNTTKEMAHYSSEPLSSSTELVSQRDARLFYLRNKLEKAVDGSNEKLQPQKELDAEIAQKEHVDNS